MIYFNREIATDTPSTADCSDYNIQCAKIRWLNTQHDTHRYKQNKARTVHCQQQQQLFEATNEQQTKSMYAIRFEQLR